MNIIKDLREDNDLKQEELAEIIGITQQSLSRYEREITLIDAITAAKIAKFFGVSTDYLMEITNNPSTDNFTSDLTSEEIKKLIEYKEMLLAYRKVKKGTK